jgi:predicted RNase H-like HicB family nuclease
VDLPGVNTQEKTKEELMETLRIGAQEMLATKISFEPNSLGTAV